MSLNSLSGRFALLTGVFVLLAELLIIFPSISNYRLNALESRLERAQIASLALLATDDSLASDLESELLQNAGVFNVVLRRNDIRQLVLSSPIPGPIAETYDLREQPFWTAIHDAVEQIVTPENRVIRVIGDPVKQAGQLIEITMDTAGLRREMIDYGLRMLLISAAFSVMTAILLNLVAQRMLLVPIRRVIRHMTAYATAPEDIRAIITPTARLKELNEAEVALAAMQRTVTSALKQKARLAQLGQAVARISHDLRNMLTTAQLFADRLETSADPAVRRAAPKLVNSITRAVNLCETTLAFGKSEEPAPILSRFNLASLVSEVIEAESLTLARIDGKPSVEFLAEVPANLMIRADRDQIYRVLGNLVRNARQALEGTGKPGTIEITGGEDDHDWWIRIGDTGPGLPQKTREFLFQPFSGASRKGGTGLGLAIAADLVRNHGGALVLVRSDEEGTEFRLTLPRELAGIPAPEAALAE